MNKQQAIIHIGAGPLQKNSIKWAKDLGLYVIVTDKDRMAPAIKYADEYHNLAGDDISSLLDLAVAANRKYEIVAAYTSSDFGMLSVAAINKILGLKGCMPEVVAVALDKYHSKSIWLQNEIVTPKAIRISSYAEIKDELDRFNYPLIVKPIDSCGSQGVKSVETADEVRPAVDAAFKFSRQVLVEEFIDGLSYDTIGIVWDGQFIPCGIGSRFFGSRPYHISLYGYTPPDLAPDKIKLAYKITADAVKALGIDYAPVKADLLYRDETFYVIEVAPRFHGDVFTSKSIPFSHHSSPIKKLFQLQCGYDHVLSYQAKSADLVACRALFLKRRSINVASILARFKQEFNLIDYFLKNFKSTGAKEHRDNSTLAGFIWAGFESRKELAHFNSAFYEKFGDIFL